MKSEDGMREILNRKVKVRRVERVKVRQGECGVKVKQKMKDKSLLYDIRRSQ